MSGRFVRASKFRHVHGEAEKKQYCYSELRPLSAGEGNYIAANKNYFAIPLQGGGGPVLAHPIKEPKRFPAKFPTVNVHKGKVLDIAFNPFYDNLMASCSDDATIKMVKLPDGNALSENINSPVVSLEGHQKRVGLIRFNPVAESIISSASYDQTVKTWDLESQSEILNFTDHHELIQSLAYNYNGSLLGTTCKDKKVRVFDPRNADSVVQIDGCQGGKSSRIFFMDNHNMVGLVGFSRSSTRKIILFDSRKLGDSIYEHEIDQAAGVLMPFYDPDTSILYVGGKGDGNIRYFEMVNDAPFLHHIDDFKSGTPHKGMTIAPKSACDYMSCEIALGFRVLRDMVEKVHFKVPRKSDLFQDDLFPDTFSGEASLTSSEWQAGENKDPKLCSIKECAGEGAVKEFVAKKSYAELEKELEAAKARIAELEAQLSSE